MVGIGIDHRNAAALHDFGKQAQLDGQVILEGRMIVHVIAGDVGEANACDLHAIQPVLVQPMAGGFDGQVIHAIGRKLRQQLVDFHRVRRGVVQRRLALGADDANGAQAGGRLAQRGPDFAQEGDDGGFALGAGDGGNHGGLRRIKGRRVTRQAQAGICIGNEACAQCRDIGFQRRRAQHGDGAA